MEQTRRPRRPAMLSATQAEMLIGDGDPAEEAVIAHTSAWALFGVADEDFGDEAVARLRQTIEAEGIDVVASMWSRSPEFTLPGALWRLYLLQWWLDRDGADVQRMWAAGGGTGATFEQVTALIGSLFDGHLTDDDIDSVLTQAAAFMRTVAAGASGGGAWITDPKDPLAHPVTIRVEALVRTAEELERAASEAAAGTLD